MANQEHLDILEQGVEIWNQWRERHPELRPDLSQAFLYGADLSEADLSYTNLSPASLSYANLLCAQLIGANLSGANLSHANLSHANLKHVYLTLANLSGANLSHADLSSARLDYAKLMEADLSQAELYSADLSFANLSHADLSGARLIDTILRDADLNEADFNGANVRRTLFDNLDLRQVKGLDTLRQDGPSDISISTIYRSEGHISETFLRKAGVPETFIEYMRSLVVNPIDFYSCFISYSSKDQDFAERLYADLQSKGVRCWFAPEDLKIGDKIRHRIDESIRLYDKLLLVLSEHSVRSQWVEHEVEMALAKEYKSNRTVLFPIPLDDSIMEIEQDGWPSEVRHTRHIGNFTRWKDHDEYQKAFNRLLRDLKAEAQKMEWREGPPNGGKS